VRRTMVCLLIVVTTIVLMGGYLMWMRADRARTTPAPSAPSVVAEKPAPEPAPPKVECTLDDLQCLYNEHLVAATLACRPLVERRAKFQHEWTDGWLDQKFSGYFNNKQTKKRNKPGVVTFVGDRVKFQNEFGAWQNMMYECDFHTRTKQVLAVRVAPGRLAN
jgi:hypothetical protein